MISALAKPKTRQKCAFTPCECRAEHGAPGCGVFRRTRPSSNFTCCIYLRGCDTPALATGTAWARGRVWVLFWFNSPSSGIPRLASLGYLETANTRQSALGDGELIVALCEVGCYQPGSRRKARPPVRPCCMPCCCSCGAAATHEMKKETEETTARDILHADHYNHVPILIAWR